MPLDYVVVIKNLMQKLPFIKLMFVIEGGIDIVYSTNNWDIQPEIGKIISLWTALKVESFTLFGEKYVIRLCTTDRIVATSIKGKGHLIGAKDEERKLIAQIEPDAPIAIGYTEMAKALISLKTNIDYNNKEEILQHGIQKTEQSPPIKKGVERRSIAISESHINPPNDGQHITINDSALLLTARLMAYYRAQESKSKSPLIIDPFAEILAGDLIPYFKEHLRYSEMDYPLVRSYYIENNLLKPWCYTNSKSQIVLLGVGLDTRAYRFNPFRQGIHIIYEIDLPLVISYKERLLKDVKPMCNLVRISADLSNLAWPWFLMKRDFSNKIPTFWILEGLVYYLERDVVIKLLAKLAEISAEKSQIFVDLMQSSRWITEPYTGDGLSSGPFSEYIKWGIDIKNVPSFFAANGWNVSCSFADEHDQGRNVGQKAMIFTEGTRAI